MQITEVDINTLKRDFPSLNLFSYNALIMSAQDAGLFAHSVISDRALFYLKSGYIHKYHNNLKATYSEIAKVFRVADFIVAYEMMILKDPLFNMTYLEGIGKKSAKMISKIILELSDGRYILDGDNINQDNNKLRLHESLELVKQSYDILNSFANKHGFRLDLRCGTCKSVLVYDNESKLVCPSCFEEYDLEV